MTTLAKHQPAPCRLWHYRHWSALIKPCVIALLDTLADAPALKLCKYCVIYCIVVIYDYCFFVQICYCLCLRLLTQLNYNNVLKANSTDLGHVVIKAAIRSIFLMSLGKNSIKTFQDNVIQVVWKNTRYLHLSLSLYSGFRKWWQWQGLFSQSRVNKWHCNELVGCWNKWHALRSKIGLW